MRNPIFTLVALLLPACAAELPTGFVPSGADSGADDVTGLPQVDPERGDELVDNAPCGWEHDHDHVEGDSGEDPHLVLTWCMRVTPEQDAHDHDHDDTGVAFDDEPDPGEVGAASSDAPDDAPPPPCTVENLVGGMRLLGPADDPVLAYCDADGDEGGTHTVSRVTPFKSFHRMVDPQSCLQDVDSAALLPDGDGALLYHLATGHTGGPQLTAVQLATGGRPVSEALPVQIAGEAVHANTVEVFAGEEGPLFLLETFEGGLLARTEAGEHTLLTDGLSRSTAVQLEEGIRVAGCTDDGALVLWSLALDGSVLAQQAVADPVCDGTSRPRLAAGPETVMLAVADLDSGGWLMALDGVDVVERIALGPDAQGPAVVWDGQRWLSVDTSGAVRAWSTDLEPLGSGEHPGITEAEGTVDSFRLVADDGGLTIATLGWDDRPTLPGHTATFNWLELSHLDPGQLLSE